MKVLSHASPRIDGSTGRDCSESVRAAAAVAMALVFLGMPRGRSRIRAGRGRRPVEPRGHPRTPRSSPGSNGRSRRTTSGSSPWPTRSSDDPSAPDQLEDQLDRLRIDAIKAEGEARYATLRREVAELALKEYVEAILPHELLAAEAALADGQDRSGEGSCTVRECHGDVEKITAQLEMKRAEFALEAAESSKKVLVEYTKPKRTQGPPVRAREGPLRRADQESRMGTLERHASRGRRRPRRPGRIAPTSRRASSPCSTAPSPSRSESRRGSSSSRRSRITTTPPRRRSWA